MNNLSIDWRQCIERVNGDKALAKKLLLLFVEHLPEAQRGINQAYQEQDFKQLSQQLHKLYGACCYCSVPNLSHILTQLREAAKANQLEDLAKLQQAFDDEIHAIHRSYEHLVKDGI